MAGTFQSAQNLVTGKCATLEVSRRHFLRILTAFLQVCVARLPNMLQ